MLQFLIGYYTYGKDRFKDALEYESQNYETRKKGLYDFLLKNKGKFSKKSLIIMNMCGRGDKDIFTVAEYLGFDLKN